jgi:hypothetical protein
LVAGQYFVVVGAVAGGIGVQHAAGLFHVLGVFAAGDVVRAFKEQMLEEMGESTAVAGPRPCCPRGTSRPRPQWAWCGPGGSMTCSPLGRSNSVKAMERVGCENFRVGHGSNELKECPAGVQCRRVLK